MKVNLRRIAGIIAIFLIVVLIIVIVVIGNKKHTNIQTDYKQEITSIAKDYYSNYYYNLIDNPIAALQEVADTGIIFTLDTLFDYKELTAKTKKILDEAKCDYATSRVIMHPETPFHADSVSVEIFFNCQEDI